MNDLKIYFSKIKTIIGDVYLYANDDYLVEISFSKSKNFKNTKLIEKDNKIIKLTKKELKEYFAGRRKHFTVPLLMVGTDFQVSAWQALTEIPFGSVVSYSDQAKKLKKTKAVRAVGSANGKNPLPIIVPCHRVIAKNDKLGGYSGGLNIKIKLLSLEGVIVGEGR